MPVPRHRWVAVLVVALVAAPALAGCILGPAGTVADQNSRSGSGDHALLYIRDDPYPKLHLVFDYVPGYGPNEEAVKALVAAAREALSKREITVSRHAILPKAGDDHAYTLDEVRAVERAHRVDFHGGDTAVMYFLYLDGHSSNDDEASNVLAIAHHGSSIVMFKNSIRAAAANNRPFIGGPSLAELELMVERSVLIHEMGHLLGLVNNGIPMVRAHEDPDPKGGRAHSSNKDSVMYRALETSAGIAGLLKLEAAKVPYRFDNDDLADIEAAKQR